MTDRIDFGGEPWRAIPRSTLRDPALSPKALGGLVTLLSHEEGWVRSAIGTLQHEKRCGREAAQAIMRELVEQGYASRELHRSENGQLRTAYTVFAVKSQVQAVELDGSRQTENPSTGEPSTGAPSAVVEAPDGEALEEETHHKALELAPTARKRDPIWDVLVAAYGTPTSKGRGAMNDAAKTLRDYGADPEDIAWVIRTLGSTELNWAVTTPQSLAKHYGERHALVAQLDRPHVYDHAAAISRGDA